MDLSILVLFSILSYCYLYTIYTDKPRLSGLKLLALVVLISISLILWKSPNSIVQVLFLFGLIGFGPLLKPALKNTFYEDFSFLEGVSISILAVTYLVNLSSLFTQL